jgi:hypothetical protein
MVTWFDRYSLIFEDFSPDSDQTVAPWSTRKRNHRRTSKYAVNFGILQWFAHFYKPYIMRWDDSRCSWKSLSRWFYLHIVLDRLTSISFSTFWESYKCPRNCRSDILLRQWTQKR